MKYNVLIIMIIIIEGRHEDVSFNRSDVQPNIHPDERKNFVSQTFDSNMHFHDKIFIQS